MRLESHEGILTRATKSVAIYDELGIGANSIHSSGIYGILPDSD